MLMVPLLLAAGAAASQAAGAQMDQASYTDEAMCAACHSDLATQFGVSMHARLEEWETRGELFRCQACHGAGSQHVEASGDPQFIYGFQGEEGREASRACVGCHYYDKGAEWPGSVHFMGGLGCGDCHTIHQSRQVELPTSKTLIATTAGMVGTPTQGPPKMASLTKPEPELCLECHNEKRAQLNYSSHHPIIERRMQCSSCHSVHGSAEDSLLNAPEGMNELCTSCHPAQHGPFVFEHAAVEEGCNTCHEPHGTVANNLLRQNEPFICLQCHEAHFHIGRDGIDTPISRATGTASNQYGSSGWRRAFTTKCTNCHPSVHGSDLPSQGISSRGGSLTR